MTNHHGYSNMCKEHLQKGRDEHARYHKSSNDKFTQANMSEISEMPVPTSSWSNYATSWKTTPKIHKNTTSPIWTYFLLGFSNLKLDPIVFRTGNKQNGGGGRAVFHPKRYSIFDITGLKLKSWHNYNNGTDLYGTIKYRSLVKISKICSFWGPNRITPERKWSTNV